MSRALLAGVLLLGAVLALALLRGRGQEAHPEPAPARTGRALPGDPGPGPSAHAGPGDAGRGDHGPAGAGELSAAGHGEPSDAADGDQGARPHAAQGSTDHAEQGAGASAAHAAHPHDAAKRGEHQALLDLLPRPELATHVAARDGAWSDPATWAGGEVPGAGAIVLVPSGIDVVYAADSVAPLFLVRVDGSLRWRAPDGARTRMVVDTLYGVPGSALAIEAAGATDGTVEIELRPFDIEAHEAAGAPGWSAAARDLYADGAVVRDTGGATIAFEQAPAVEDGPGVLGRYAWDPAQLSLGLISHGSARIEGRARTGRVVLAEPARRGDTSLLLTAPPDGWAPGDSVLVVGTTYVGRDLVSGASLGSQDELVTVARLEGARVHLDRALTHDHVPQRPDLRLHAANLTRNVVLKSAFEPPLEAEAVGALASRLGHVMFMHDPDVTVRHAAFRHLGRSNKNDVLDDLQRRDFDGLDASRRYQMVAGHGSTRPTLPRSVTNPRGRYAVHLHRTGATAGDAVALVEGCVVVGGPGWGFVSHDSRADFRGNVAYGVLGAGFVAETGNETGTWEGNLAAYTYGAAFNSPRLDPRGLYRYENDDSELTIELEKRGAWKNHDFGHFGNGFWFQGKLIDVRDNVSASSGLQGYFFSFRAPDQIDVDPATLAEPLAVHSPDGIHPFAPGLDVFVGNESIADRGGLIMVGIGGGRTSDERSVIADFTAWEVGQVGTEAQYYPGYVIRDSTFLASASPGANPTSGVLFLRVQTDTVLANLTVEGFPLMYDLRKSWSAGARNQQGFDDPYEVAARALAAGEENPLPLGYAHVVVDAPFTRAEAGEPQFMGATFREEDLLLTSADLVPGRLEVELDDDSLRIDLDQAEIPYGWLREDPARPTLQEGHVLLLRGTKRDSVGEIPIDYLNNTLVWHPDAVQHRLETQGYYHMPGGGLGVLLEEVFADRYTAERLVVRFVAELDPRWDLTGAIDLGPFDPAEHPDVVVPAFLLGG